MKLWRIALRNVARNKRRSLLSGSAIAVATLTVVLLFSVLGGMLGDVVATALTYDSGHVRVRHAEYGRYETLNPVHLAVTDAGAVVERLQALPEVTGVLPRVRFAGAIYREQRNHGAFGLGLDFAREIAVARARLPQMSGTAAGAATLEEFARAWQLAVHGGSLPRAGERELLISAALAEELGLAAGDKLTILTRTALLSTQAWTFTVSGVIGFPIGGMRGLLLAPLDVVQRFLKLTAADGVSEILLYTGSEEEVPALTAAVGAALPDADPGFAVQAWTETNFLKLNAVDGVTEILLYTGSEEEVPALAAALAGALQDRDPGLAVQAWTETNPMFSMLQLATRIYDIIALFFFLLATTVIVNTTMMVVFERMKEIGTIAALGMTGNQITRLFFLEALFIGMGAALLGVALGCAIVLPLSQVGIDYSAAMEGVELNMSDVLFPRLSVRSTVLVFLYSIAVTAAASYWPARKAARLHPVVALRAA
jgi:putative ABC transport system permease protein